MITPTRDPRIAVLSKDLRSLFTFYFSIDTALQSNNYIKITFQNYVSINPQNCLLFANSKWISSSSCALSPGLSDNRLYIQLPLSLSPNVEYILQVDLLNANPNYYLSNNYEIYTQSSDVDS
jgi:hypothetical protein